MKISRLRGQDRKFRVPGWKTKTEKHFREVRLTQKILKKITPQQLYRNTEP